MADEPNYLDGLRSVDQLLLSMESDFLTVLAAHQRAEVELVSHNKGDISDPSHSGVNHPRRSVRRQRKANGSSRPPSDRRSRHPGTSLSPMSAWWWWCGLMR
jgi:hypothetical protein